MEQYKHQLIRATAGAGKTTTLIQAVLDSINHYFKKHGVFPRVAVSTFTRKATRELKERLIIKAMEAKNPDLIKYVCYSPRLHISTLHGLFYHFIQTKGTHIGFSPMLSIMDEKESHNFFISLLKKVLLQQKKGVTLLEHYSFEEISHIVKQYIFPDVLCAKSAPVSRQEMTALIETKQAELEQALEQKKSSLKEKELSQVEKQKELLDVFYILCEELKILGQELLVLSQQKKRELNKLSLSDLELMTWQILSPLSPQTQDIPPRLTNIVKEQGLVQRDDQRTVPQPLSPQTLGWDFWFLDEYQDTSLMQKKILDKLSYGSRVFIVGDPQQSIYYFRGADAGVFSTKEQEMTKGPDSHVRCLLKNYRSHPELISFFNHFFAEKNYHKMEAEKKNVSLSREAVRFELSSTGGEEQEFLSVTKCIQELQSQGASLEGIAVLGRQNKALRNLAQHLKANHIPFHLHSSGGFIKRREVRDALFLWRFLLNPHDDENFISLLRTPYLAFSDKSIVKSCQAIYDWRKSKGGISLWHFLLNQTAVLKEEGEGVLALKQAIEKSKKVGLVVSFQEALFSLGFMDLSYYQDPTGVGFANLWKLIYSLKKHEGRDSLFAFSENVFRGQVAEGMEEGLPSSQNALSATESSGVQLMTIHAAKGLEFKHVILIKVCAGFRGGGSFSYFAQDRNTGNYALSVRSEEEDKRIESLFHKKVKEQEREQELEEFDRLLYVAMTRAQNTLTLIGAGKPEKDSWPRRFSYFSKL